MGELWCSGCRKKGNQHILLEDKASEYFWSTKHTTGICAGMHNSILQHFRGTPKRVPSKIRRRRRWHVVQWIQLNAVHSHMAPRFRIVPSWTPANAAPCDVPRILFNAFCGFLVGRHIFGDLPGSHRKSIVIRTFAVLQIWLHESTVSVKRWCCSYFHHRCKMNNLNVYIYKYHKLNPSDQLILISSICRCRNNIFIYIYKYHIEI